MTAPDQIPPSGPADAAAEAELDRIRDRSAQTAARNDAAMIRAVMLAILAGLALDALVVLAALLLGGEGAVLGALAGTGLALIVTLPTLVSARIGARQGPAAMAAVVLGAWLVKMIALVGALILLRGLDGLSSPWMGVALLIGAVVPAVVEALLLLRSRPRLEVR